MCKPVFLPILFITADVWDQQQLWEHDPISLPRDAPIDWLIHSFVFVFSSIQIRFLRMKLEKSGVRPLPYQGHSVEEEIDWFIVTTTEKNALKYSTVITNHCYSVEWIKCLKNRNARSRSTIVAQKVGHLRRHHSKETANPLRNQEKRCQQHEHHLCIHHAKLLRTPILLFQHWLTKQYWTKHDNNITIGIEIQER